ncbi:signal transduction histidine kinase [Nocardioides cavernae]|uniref:histidine kinase n=1 Tax=Nocardioides cavernae TaxID=1921566 RepID=A0A7Y9KQV1_9ACTN|nr:HAMP domain-containing sensor histidine kinase [Nocardioides cavernae]NYE35924.1 signal transduction histidine kinase [Nocardioides cavernae]
MIEHPALQYPTATGRPSSAATALALRILGTEAPVDEAIEAAARHLLGGDRVEVFLAALTSLPPAEGEGWRQLGGRAWLREWLAPGATRSFVPPPGAGPEAALTMPWTSRRLRACGVAAITDRDLLPADEAAQDIAELAGSDVRSLVSSAWTSGEVMFGSMSLISLQAGEWPEDLLQDFALLNAALISRLSLEHSRRALAEAIESGTQAQDAFQQFFGAVGHELRTPVSSILGYTEVLIDEADHAPDELLAAAMLRDGPVIVRQCERLLGIVDSLLGAGRTLSDDEERQDVLIADAVADVVHWHRSPAGTAGVEMVVDIDPAATVRAHASGVRQVLTSLVGNAIAHHNAEGGTVHISTSRMLGESGQAMVRIIVRDDGPGLPPEDLEKAFDPFAHYAGFSAQSSGLGLPMARTLAERDGGAVRGESAPGVGSSFWLELPVRDPAG